MPSKTSKFDRPLGPQAPNERTVMEPIGVTALITPWNWPMNQIVLKAVPALAVWLHHGVETLRNRSAFRPVIC